MSKITIEALKESGRYFISSLLSTIVVCLGVIAIGINTSNVTVSINWNLVLLSFILGLINGLIGAITRFTDKWQHEFGKENKTYQVEQTPSMGWLSYFIK